eukprot:153924-Amphidinium_carterae.1
MSPKKSAEEGELAYEMRLRRSVQDYFRRAHFCYEQLLSNLKLSDIEQLLEVEEDGCVAWLRRLARIGTAQTRSHMLCLSARVGALRTTHDMLGVEDLLDLNVDVRT